MTLLSGWTGVTITKFLPQVLYFTLRGMAFLLPVIIKFKTHKQERHFEKKSVTMEGKR